jgi:hypothetical protein
MKCAMAKYPLLVFAILMVLLTGCNDPKLESKWRDREITIDGVDSEWEACRLYYDEDTRTTLGRYNDDAHLYLSLSTGDPVLQHKIIGQGLYTWFNPRGNKEKRVGILFPTGTVGKFIPGQDGGREKGAGKGPSEGDRRPGGHSILLQDDLEMSSPDLEFHIPEKDYETNILLEEIRDFGFDAKLKRHGARLVYELKIPLTENDSRPDLAIGAGSGWIGIGFETRKHDRKSMKGSRGKGGAGGPGEGRGPGGGKGGRGGGRGGSGGKGSRMDRPGGKGGGSGGPDHKGLEDMGKVYELWTRVELASRP